MTAYAGGNKAYANEFVKLVYSDDVKVSTFIDHQGKDRETGPFNAGRFVTPKVTGSIGSKDRERMYQGKAADEGYDTSVRDEGWTDHGLESVLKEMQILHSDASKLIAAAMTKGIQIDLDERGWSIASRSGTTIFLRERERPVTYFAGVTPNKVTVREAATALYDELKATVGNIGGEAITDWVGKHLTHFGGPASEGYRESEDDIISSSYKAFDQSLKEDAVGIDFGIRVSLQIYRETVRDFAIGNVTGLGIAIAARKIAGKVMRARRLECFPAGTLVDTATGKRAIETVTSGDQVWSFDLAKNRWDLRQVLETFERTYTGLLFKIVVSDDAIETTDTHPFWIVEGEGLEARPRTRDLTRRKIVAAVPGRWVDAQDLLVGDKVLLRSGEIASIRQIEAAVTTVSVYNFHVAEFENYAVGQRSILVHNENFKPGSEPHKAQRWKEYQEARRPLKYEQWSKKYDAAMKNSEYGLLRESQYRLALGGDNKVIQTGFGRRQIDCFVPPEPGSVGKGICYQIKTGKEYLTTKGRLPNQWAIERDKWLVDNFFEVVWVLEKGASRQLKDALKAAGIKIRGKMIK